MDALSEIREACFSHSEHPDLEGKNPFGRFVGSWDIEWTGHNREGGDMHQKGEWHFAWALEGRAIQDIFIVPGRENRGKPGFPTGEYGTTIRFFSPAENAVRAVWIGPGYSLLRTFTVSSLEDRLVLNTDDARGPVARWSFTQITDDSFVWIDEVQVDGEWERRETMRVTRRKGTGVAGLGVERIWHGWTTLENASKYEALLKEEIFTGIAARRIPGYQGIRLLTRQVGDEVEFITIMRFDSIASVALFAGEDYERCVVPESARRVLKRFDERSQHYDLRAMHQY